MIGEILDEADNRSGQVSTTFQVVITNPKIIDLSTSWGTILNSAESEVAEISLTTQGIEDGNSVFIDVFADSLSSVFSATITNNEAIVALPYEFLNALSDSQTYMLQASAVDSDGISTNIVTSTLNLDYTPPTAVISTDVERLQSGATAQITFSLSELSDDFDPTSSSIISVSYGSLINGTVSGTTYTAQYTQPGTEQNNVVFTLIANSFRDLAGNSNTASATLVLALNSAPEGTPAPFEVTQDDPDMVVDLTDGVTDPDGDPMQVANFSVSYSLANISEGIYMPLTDNELKLKFEQVLKETNLEGNNLNIYISNSLFLTANQIGKIEMTYDITDGIYTTPVVNKIFITGKNDAPASADVVQTTTYKVDSAGSRLKDLQGNDVREEIIEGVTVMAAVEGTDPDSGDSIIYEINPEVTVSTGALEFNSDGSYSFVPEEHFYGEVTFEYFIEDSSGAKEGPYQVRIIVAENPDDDGIPTRLEALGKSTDIDGDGMPDRKQNNISHFPMTSAADFEAAKAWALNPVGPAPAPTSYGAILVGSIGQKDGGFNNSNYRSDPNAKLKDLAIKAIPEEVQENFDYNADLYSFGIVPAPGTELVDLDGDPTNGLQTRVILDLPSGIVATTFIKQLPTGEFLSFKDDQDLETWDDGATLIDQDGDGLVDRIVITITDNGVGDFDPTVGSILDPGGLGIVKPIIDDASAGSFDEGLSAGTILYDVNEKYSGLDTDLEGDLLTYSLSADNPLEVLSAVRINAATGEITVEEPDMFDFEQFVDQNGVSKFNVLVSVEDPFGYSDTATVEVTLVNVDEKPSIISETEVDFMEQQPVETIVVDIETLPDYQDITTFSILEGKDSNQLVIEPSSGRVRFVSSPVFEEKDLYVIDVLAVDISGKTDTAEFRIHILGLDDDGDGIENIYDNCITVSNPDQSDNDQDGLGDACDPDDDNDGILDTEDNCPFTPNPDQLDTDGDGIGDTCDPDDDNDTVLDEVDNCPLIPNLDQADIDGDGLGDVCDGDFDNDGVLDEVEIEDGTDPADPCSLIVMHQTEAMGTANWDTLDCDGDGIQNQYELNQTSSKTSRSENFTPLDSDGDGIYNFMDPDDDADGILTKFEVPDANGDGKPDDALDSDGEQIPNYLDVDDDNDTILTKDELPDENGDGIPDDALDTDGELVPDYLDIDDDDDTINTIYEVQDTNGDGMSDLTEDSDGDGIPNYRDNDDDGDGIFTKDEIKELILVDGNPIDAQDSDGDGIPDYSDPDDDNDQLLSVIENEIGTDPLNIDTDRDGVTDYVEYVIDRTDPLSLCSLIRTSQTVSSSINSWNALDCDGDGIMNLYELDQDSDQDGTSDLNDRDDDGDGLSSALENADPNADGNPEDAYDSDGDGIADYLDYNAYLASSTVASDLEIYNAISPNGDSYNDVFTIRNIEKYPDNELMISNQWGQEVYRAKGYGQNGKYFNGVRIGATKPLPVGVYYYVLKVRVNEQMREFKGYLYINN